MEEGVPRPSVAKHRKILLVDDCKTSLLVHEFILMARDVEIVKAASGLEGLSRAVAEQPDLILLDIEMPDANGLEVLRALRSREETRHIPVMLVSVHGDLATLDQAIHSGCRDFLTKPVDARVLKRKVRRHLAA